VEVYEMSTKESFAVENRVLLTILITMGWLILMLCWIVFAWGQYSFFQILTSLGVATMLFAAITAVLWVADQGFRLAAMILTTLGWLSFVLYWIGFVWSRHTLLQNGAVLLLSFLVCGGADTVLCLMAPRFETRYIRRK